jgi:threonine dehydrogenase-like Zn-dependent dehydrogenase
MSRLFRLMLTGRVDPTPMTTHEVSFDDVEHAFHLMETKAEGIIKPLVLFD